MHILIIGGGGVGASMLSILETREFFTKVTIADINLGRAQAAVDALDDPTRFAAIGLNADVSDEVARCIRDTAPNIVVNACDPRVNESIFAACEQEGVHYMDMALTLSKPHPDDPFKMVGAPLGESQWAAHERWKAKNILALVGMGVEPGLANVFARYAYEHLFDVVEEVGVRDGSNLSIDGYDFAPTFSIWTTLEECLNPPVVWEKSRGLYTTECFSEPEVFHFPAGIGPVECVNVEHEEVLMIPREIPCDRVTFKYGLGAEFIDWLKTFAYLGLDSTEKIKVGEVHVAPRDVLAALLPAPSQLGHLMHGKTCAGTWVKGTLDGKPKEIYMYHIADNDTTMREWGAQAVLWQTAVCPVVALELLARGAWAGRGVKGPEAFDPIPFLNLLGDYNAHHGVLEMGPGLWPSPKQAARVSWDRPVHRPVRTGN